MNTLPPARQDGRPLYYDLEPGARVQCVLCLREENYAQFGRGEAVICDPANSPLGDEAVYTMALQRLPDNAVIFDPVTGLCRTKDGTQTWKED